MPEKTIRRVLEEVTIPDDPKYNFKVKAGASFGQANEYKTGDVIELTVKEAKGFLDLLAPADGEAAEAVAALKEDSPPTRARPAEETFVTHEEPMTGKGEVNEGGKTRATRKPIK